MKTLQKIIAYSLVLSFLLYCSPYVFADDSLSSSDELSGQPIIIDEDRFLEIDRLYSLRSLLSTNWEENYERIHEIDLSLQSLGVTVLTTDEIASKNINNISPMVDLPSSSHELYTSVRQIAVYNGQSYELQIIRVIPNDSSSVLYGSDLSYANTTYGTEAGLLEIIKIATYDGTVSFIDYGTSGAASAALTFLDIFRTYFDELSSTTSVGPVSCSYTTAFNVEEIYIYVKYQGQTDSDQVLCYVGNKVSGHTLVAIPSHITVDGTVYSSVNSENIYFTIACEGYSYYSHYACREFWDWNQNYNFQNIYRMINFKLTVPDGQVNNTRTISVPVSHTGLLH